MDARRLTHGTNVVLVAAVGMTAGHLLMPARPVATIAERGSFVALLALAGAIAGWREHSVLSYERGMPVPRGALWICLGALLALAAGALAWRLVHG